jgi:nicotinamidase-related amidase
MIADMLVDFADPQGKLFVPETRKTIAPIRALLNRVRRARAAVIYIQDWHRSDDPEFAIWGPHAVEGTPGTQVIPQIAPKPREIVVRKRTYDPFFDTDLDLLLRQKRIENLIITGTVANICVLQAAASGSLRGYRIIVPVDTVSALNPFDYEVAWRQISFVYQGRLTHSKQIQFLQRGEEKREKNFPRLAK